MTIRLSQSRLSIDQCIVIAVFMFPVVFLTVRSGVHVFLFGLLLVTFIEFFRKANARIQFSNREDWILFLMFSGLFIAVLISQLFRQKLYMPAFDGPSRILFAGFIFLLLKTRNIQYINILAIAIPISLICVLLEVELNHLPHASWGGRYAAYFVDPNTLGSQTFILGLLSLFLIGSIRETSLAIQFLKLAGGLAGIYIAIHSGSRGAWLLAPFVLLMMLIIRVGDIYSADHALRLRMWAHTGIFTLLIVLIFVVIYLLSNTFSDRILSAYNEITNWFLGKDLASSAGTRLAIWTFSFQFAAESWLFGYGEEKNMMQILQNSSYNSVANEIAIKTMALTGPHSDILSKLLSSGLIGLVAYLAVLWIPFYFFWNNRNAALANNKKAARIGMCYVVGVFIAGLSNEQLSLKYLCSFYGLMIATLLAQVLNQPTAQYAANKASNSKSRT